MATRKIVPRADSEGGLGTTAKRWASAFVNALTVTTSITGDFLTASLPVFTGASKELTTKSVADARTALEVGKYEAGSWTPVLTRATTAPTTVTYTSQVGFYIKIGKLVFVACMIRVSALTADGAGTNIVTGLPFTVRDIAYLQFGSLGYNDVFETTNGRACAPFASTTTVGFVPNLINQYYIDENYRAFPSGVRFLSFSAVYEATT